MSAANAFGDGPDNASSLNVLLRRGKRHDYFTSALPWPQKGPGVELPLGTSAPIIGTLHTGSTKNIVTPYWERVSNGYVTGMTNKDAQSRYLNVGEGIRSLSADLSEATAATINSLRQAF